jgi:hypothetical protein
MRVGPYRYSLLDRALAYFTLFLIGLIGWTCDRLPQRLQRLTNCVRPIRLRPVLADIEPTI